MRVTSSTVCPSLGMNNSSAINSPPFDKHLQSFPRWEWQPLPKLLPGEQEHWLQQHGSWGIQPVKGMVVHLGHDFIDKTCILISLGDTHQAPGFLD